MTITSLSFDVWRASYDRMTFAEHVTFNNDIATLYPDQAAWQPGPVIDAVAGTRSVVEVGGWRGELADTVLDEMPTLDRWTNYDICEWAIDHTTCESDRYHAIQLEQWPWETDLEQADVFVASHMIEHIRFHELYRLVLALESRFTTVHFQAPLDRLPVSWGRYHGSHILEVGWDAVERLMSRWELSDSGAYWRTWRAA